MNEKKPFAKQAAKASWAIPIIAVFMETIGKSAQSSTSVFFISLLTAFFFAIGFILSIISFYGIKTHGKQGILLPGIIGLLINSIFLTLIVVGFVSGYKHAYQWQTFKPSDGKFSVSMPSLPSERIEKVDSPSGPLDIHSFLVQRREVLYIVSYMDFPEVILEQSGLDVLMDRARDANIKSVNGSLLSENKLLLHDKYRGREITFDSPSSAKRFLWRAYVVNNRLYQLVVSLPKDKADSFTEDTAKFVDSFHLLEQ